MNDELKKVHKVNKSDEWHTPEKAVQDLLPFIDRGFRNVLCPFDNENSNFVRVLQSAGFNVTFGDLKGGKDFFTAWNYNDYDIVISNPPFSKRGEILKTLISAGVPFILLLNPDGMLEARERYYLFADNAESMSILFPRRNLKYIHSDGTATKSCPFYSAWFAYKANLPQVVFMRNE